MSDYLNTRARNLSPYTPGEQPKDMQIIKLNTNENPYPPSPKVIQAIQKAACPDLRLYPDPECTHLRQVIAAHFGVKPQQVFAGNGSDEILAFAFGAFYEKTILFPDITYSFYPSYADLWDIPYSLIPLREDFSLKISDYRIPCDGVVLANPNAPTGMTVPLDDILFLAEFHERQKKVLIIDEAYAAFGAQSVSSYINKYPNLLVVHTLSKSASLAGLRAGFAIGSEKLIEALRRMRDSFNSYTVDRLALAGAEAAVADWQYYKEINEKVAATRDRVTEILRNLDFFVLPSKANFIFIKYPGISGEDFHNALRERGILARHFKKERICDFMRVSIGTDEQMDKFINECKDIIARSIK